MGKRGRGRAYLRHETHRHTVFFNHTEWRKADETKLFNNLDYFFAQLFVPCDERIALVAEAREQRLEIAPIGVVFEPKRKRAVLIDEVRL